MASSQQTRDVPCLDLSPQTPKHSYLSVTQDASPTCISPFTSHEWPQNYYWGCDLNSKVSDHHEKELDEIGYESLFSGTESSSRLSSIPSTNSEDVEGEIASDCIDCFPESADTSSLNLNLRIKTKQNAQHSITHEVIPRRHSVTERGSGRNSSNVKFYTPILSPITSQVPLEDIPQTNLECTDDTTPSSSSQNTYNLAASSFMSLNGTGSSVESLKNAAGSSHSPSLTSSSLRQVRSLTPQNSIFLSRPSVNQMKLKSSPLVLTNTSSFAAITRSQSANVPSGSISVPSNSTTSNINYVQQGSRGSDLESQGKVTIKNVPTGKIDSIIQSVCDEIFQDSVTTMAYGLVVSGLTLWIFAVLIFMNKIPGFDFDETGI